MRETEKVSVDDGELRKISGRVVGHAKHDQGAIVVRRCTGSAVAVGRGQNLFRDFLSRVCRRKSGKKRAQALGAELFLSGILGFQDAVGCEKDDITRSQFDGCFFVLTIGNEAKRDAFEADRLHRSVANEKRIWTAGVSKSEAARRGIVGREEHGDEARVEPVVVQTAIESREHFRGRTEMCDHMLAEHADRERAVERGGSAFAGNVSKREAEAAFAVREELVGGATQFVRRNIRTGEIQARTFTRAVPKQAALNFTSHLEILLETELRVARLLVKARVFESDGDIRA